MLCLQVLWILPVPILEARRECQRSTSPFFIHSRNFLILFFSGFHCELSSWVPSPTLETTALWTFQVRTFETIFF